MKKKTKKRKKEQEVKKMGLSEIDIKVIMSNIFRD